MRTGNLFVDAQAPATGERFEALLEHRNLVIERIVSSAAITPRESVQSQDEWVAVLQGEATLEVSGTSFALQAGDYLFLPAGTPHTVRRVSEGAIWLAVHLHQVGCRAGDTPHAPEDPRGHHAQLPTLRAPD